MPIDRDEVIQVVAKEHGILLGKDDPILSFLAVHDVVLRSYADQFQELGERMEGKLEAVSREYGKNTAEVSDSIAEHTKNKLKGAVQDTASDLNELLKDIVSDERQKYRDNLESLVSEARKANKRAILATCVSILSAGVSVAAVLLIML